MPKQTAKDDREKDEIASFFERLAKGRLYHASDIAIIGKIPIEKRKELADFRKSKLRPWSYSQRDLKNHVEYARQLLKFTSSGTPENHAADLALKALGMCENQESPVDFDTIYFVTALMLWLVDFAYSGARARRGSVVSHETVYGTKADKEKHKAECREAFADLRRRNPHLSKSRCYENIGKKFRRHPRTIKRYIEGK